MACSRTSILHSSVRVRQAAHMREPHQLVRLKVGHQSVIMRGEHRAALDVVRKRPRLQQQAHRHTGTQLLCMHT